MYFDATCVIIRFNIVNVLKICKYIFYQLNTFWRIKTYIYNVYIYLWVNSCCILTRILWTGKFIINNSPRINIIDGIIIHHLLHITKLITWRVCMNISPITKTQRPLMNVKKTVIMMTNTIHQAKRFSTSDFICVSFFSIQTNGIRRPLIPWKLRWLRFKAISSFLSRRPCSALFTRLNLIPLLQMKKDYSIEPFHLTFILWCYWESGSHIDESWVNNITRSHPIRNDTIKSIIIRGKYSSLRLNYILWTRDVKVFECFASCVYES